MPAATTDPSTGPAVGTRSRARAFGLAIDASFAAPGLAPLGADASRPATSVDLVPEDEVDRDWPADGVERVLEETFDDDEEPARTIDVHPDHGYRLYARDFGLARISPDGAAVLCAPPGAAEWDWQRFLVGRILPWAAVLRGYEVFHASAVSIGGRVAAFVGHTGMGKTSIALRLVSGGAELVTDDVLAVEAAGQEVRAYAGAGIAAVRPAERAAIGAEAWAGLGTELGHSGKTYLALPVAEDPLPLGAIYFLRRGDRAIEPLTPPDPRLLLASTFVLGVQTPARLANQLDVCAAIARGVPAFGLAVGDGDAGSLAAAVSEHLASVGVAV